MASKTTSVPYCVKLIEDETALKKIKRYPNNLTIQQKNEIKIRKRWLGSY